MLWLIESAAQVVVVLGSSITDGVLPGRLPGLVAIAAGGVSTRLRVPAIRGLIREQLVDAGPVGSGTEPTKRVGVG